MQSRSKEAKFTKRLSLKSELAEIERTSDKGYNYKRPNCSHDERKPNELPLSAPVPVRQTMGLGFVDSQRSISRSHCPIKQNATSMKNVVSHSADSADECEIMGLGLVHSHKSVSQSNWYIKQNPLPVEDVVSDSETA